MSPEKELIELRKELVEQLGVSLEKRENLAPIAARLMAVLVVNCERGICFDELVHELGASKSTISTHLSHLTSVGLVDYITKPGDRKRYFILTPNRILQFIDEKINMWEEDKIIHLQLINYKTRVSESKPESPCDISFHSDFLQFLDEAIALFTRLKLKIKNKHLNNHN